MRSPFFFVAVLATLGGCAGELLDGGAPADATTTPASTSSSTGDAGGGAASGNGATTAFPPTGIFAPGAEVSRLTPYPRNLPEVLAECSQPVLAPADRVVPRTLDEIVLLLQGGLVRCEPGAGVTDLLGVDVGANVVGIGMQASTIGGPLSKVTRVSGGTFDFSAPGCIEGFCLGEIEVGYPTLTTRVGFGATRVTRTHGIAFDRTRGVVYLTTPEGETVRLVRLGN